MTKLKNILIIGMTGSGKSTLANIITGTSEFKESSGSVSETRNIQSIEKEVDGIKYRIIDTVGIGDTKMVSSDWLYELAKIGNYVKDGLTQILFVTKESNFTKDENTIKEAYEMLKKYLFDEKVTGYMTIVRTNFPGFRNKSKCDKDKEGMLKNNKGFSEVIEKCFERIIYVDNPSITGIDDEDEREQNKNRRAKSKNIWNEYLRKISQDISIVEDNKYKPDNLKKLNELVDDYLTKEVTTKEEKEEIIAKVSEHIKVIEENLKTEAQIVIQK